MGIYAAMILSILFGLAMAYAATIHFRRGNLTPGAFAFWLIVWIIFLVVASTAWLWTPFLQEIKLATRLFDVVVAGMLIVLVVNSFRNALQVTQLERKIHRLMEELAIKDSVKSGHLPVETSDSNSSGDAPLAGKDRT